MGTVSEFNLSFFGRPLVLIRLRSEMNETRAEEPLRHCLFPDESCGSESSRPLRLSRPDRLRPLD